MTEPIRPEIREITGREDAGSQDEKLLYSLLAEGITRLLNEPNEKVFQILYRLDVAESKVQGVLKNCMPKNWPEELAKLIMEREKQRQYWRLKYQQDTDSNPSGENQPEQRR